MRIILCLSLTLAVAYCTRLLPHRDHNCETFEPNYPDANEGTENENPLKTVTIEPVDDSNAYVHGSKLKVKVEMDRSVATFIIQARKMAVSMAPFGTWETADSNSLLSTTYDCSATNDTLGNQGYVPTQHVEGIWTAPESQADSVVYEFFIGLANPDKIYWTKFHSQTVEMHSTPQAPKEDESDKEEEEDKQNEVDLHDAKREEEMAAEWRKKQELMTADEDKESEGDWTKRAEQERQEHEKEIHDELIEYEERLAREEEERQQRIRAEIVDKEEWEREQIKKQEEDKFRPDGNEVGYDKEKGLVVGDGASSVVASVLTLVLSIFAMYL